MTVPRIACCIPGCRRTFKREEGESADAEIMCGKHWRTIDPRLRERHKQMRRRDRKLERLSRRKEFQGPEKRAAWECIATMFDRRIAESWRRCVEDATIKAAFNVETAKADRALAAGLKEAR